MADWARLPARRPGAERWGCCGVRRRGGALRRAGWLGAAVATRGEGPGCGAAAGPELRPGREGGRVAGPCGVGGRAEWAPQSFSTRIRARRGSRLARCRCGPGGATPAPVTNRKNCCLTGAFLSPPPRQEKQQYNLLNARLASSCHRGNCTAQRGSERQLSWQSQVALFRASSQLHFLLLPKA